MFPGSGEWLNPGWYRNNPGALPTAAAVAIPTMTAGDPRSNLLPPFNWISKFRDPGKINLNTISSPAVYAGLFHDQYNEDNPAGNVNPDGRGRVHPGPRWYEDDEDDQFVRSRRGYGPAAANMLAFGNLPSFFTNPFRSAEAGSLVPLA